MAFLYVVIGIITLAVLIQAAAARRGGSDRPSIDRYHRAMGALGEMSDHVKVLDGHTSAEHEASGSLRDARPVGRQMTDTLPPTAPAWTDAMTARRPVAPQADAPSSPEAPDTSSPPFEKAKPSLELHVELAEVSGAEQLPSAGEVSEMHARESEGTLALEPCDEIAPGLRGIGDRALQRLRALPAWAIVVAAVVVLGGSWAGVLLASSTPAKRTATTSHRSGHRPTSVTYRALPDFVGLPTTQAEANATSAGLTWQVIRVPSPDAAAVGHVLAQAPAFPGTLAKGGVVTLRVGEKLAFVTLPSVTNQSAATAEATLSKADFVPRTQPVKATTIGQLALEGDVLREVPAGGRGEAKRSVVTLDVVTGAANVDVPAGVIGDTPAQAGAALAGAQMRVGTTSEAFSTSVPAGEVSSTSPAVGKPIAVGTTVNLVVSNGPPAVVPRLRGDTLAEARRALRAAKLALGKVHYAPGASGIVLAQAARVGRTLPPGTAITLVVGAVPAGSSGATPTTAGAGNSGT